MNEEYKLGKTKIKFISNNLTDEELKKNLRTFYDVINDIAQNHAMKGESVNDWFYSEEEIKKMKKDSSYKFL